MLSMLTYNMDDGYAEGICRGYKSSMLTSQHYLNLSQCDSLEDVRLQLSSTSYGQFLQNEPSPLATSTIAEKCTEIFVEEYRYLLGNATGDLKRFLEYVSYGYMIDNVILLITGTLHERDTHELLERCHPLGTWDAMPALCVATNVIELYNTVLVDTPLAPYFKNCLSAQDLDELNIEIIRNTLYKAYLEDFHRFCVQEMDPITAELMHDVLSFEADRRTLNITINSFGTELSKDQRVKLFPSMGKLFPEGQMVLARADEVEHEYRGYLDAATAGAHDPMTRSLEDRFFEREVHLNKLAFLQQFNYAIYYAYAKLKEQEIRNIVWIAECVAQGQKDRVSSYIPIF